MRCWRRCDGISNDSQFVIGILDYRLYFLPYILHVDRQALKALADGRDLAIQIYER